MTQPQRIKITNSRFKATLLTAGSTGFVVAGTMILIDSKGQDSIGWLSTAFFAACGVVGIQMLFDSRPRLIIDRTGVYDRTIGVGKIPWSEITNAYLKSIDGNDFICLQLRNPNIYQQQLSPTKKFLTKANEALGFTPISLNLSGTNADSYQILELILKYSELHS